MYAHFYQLSESPFNLTPDPKFHYINASTREAMASILHGIKARKGFITLIGEAGTGKTTLLKRVLDEIEGETQIVFVFNPGVSFDELLEFICMELGVAADGGRRLQLLDKLNAYLLEQLTLGRNVVVMIDEAQTLDAAVLEELRLLSNLETSKEKILQILLAGQPELEDKLRKPNLRQLRQRIAVRATLKPMRPDEIGPYVETRLRSAGADRIDFFTPPALRKVWRASKGIPRVVNVICDNAMMIAFAEGKRRITTGVMAEAIRDLYSRGEDGALDRVRGWLAQPALRYAAGVVAGLALSLPIALTFFPSGPSDAGRDSGDMPQTIPAPAAAPAAEHASAAQAGSPPIAVAAGASDTKVAGGALEPSPSAPDVESDPLRSDAIRDSMRRAEIIARSTAARLYPPSDPGAEHAPAKPVRPEERIVDLGRADSRGEALGRASTELDGSALVSLQGPLGEDEAVAFKPDPSVKDGEEAGTDPIKSPTAARAPAELEQPESVPAQRGDAAVSALKPVKAASVSVENAAEGGKPNAGVPTATRTDAATAAGQKASGSRGTEERLARPEKVQGAKPLAAAPVADLKAAVAEPRPAQPEVAALQPETVRTLGPSADEPIVGQLVRVTAGDTLWDIAVTYYGTAGPATLKRILNGNPGIRDPRQLDAGSHIYLPWQRPEQMVNEDTAGTFSVLIAIAPLESRLGPSRRWIESLGGDGRLTTSALNGAEKSYQLRVTGFASREAAVHFATLVLERQGKLGQTRSRTGA